MNPSIKNPAFKNNVYCKYTFQLTKILPKKKNIKYSDAKKYFKYKENYAIKKL